MTTRTITIIYPYFFPGFKAGGPIQSLANMIVALHKQYQFQVITSAFDLGGADSYSGVKLDEWNVVEIAPGCSVDVYYNSALSISPGVLKRVMGKSPSNIIYVNGMFTGWATWPLVKRINDSRLIVCPRGMLQQGALSGKSFKKKVFLNALKLIGAFRNVSWHATNVEEKADVQKQIGANAHIEIAENIPRRPYSNAAPAAKVKGQLRLIYLSLIAEKKNLLLAIKAIKPLKNVTLDIYGPVKDTAYWNACAKELQSVTTINYKGDVAPVDVQRTIEKYDAMISPTKGENFGHALYECLSVGRPLITSHFTPWQKLQSAAAGWNVDIASSEKISLLLQQIADEDAGSWQRLCEGALSLAKSYYETAEFEKKYASLFEARN